MAFLSAPDGQQQPQDNAASVKQQQLRTMIMSFRIQELQALLIFAGKPKAGRKTDLRNRALDLLSLKSTDISLKIHELSAAMYKGLGMAPSVNPYSANYQPPPTAPSSLSPMTIANSSFMPQVQAPVQLKRLPFFRVLSTLLQPSQLQESTAESRFQRTEFRFCLTPQQASLILESGYRNAYGRLDYLKQVQVRFWLVQALGEKEDQFPASISVKVNNKPQALPSPILPTKAGADPKLPPQPLNVTNCCNLSGTLENSLEVSWAVEAGREYGMSIYLVEKLTALDLLTELQARGVQSPEVTRNLIRAKLNDSDSEIATMSCKVTLTCPLGLKRMTYPCKASSCNHLQCFDASLYLKMNEHKSKWRCPVCNQPAAYEDLFLDGYCLEVLASRRLPALQNEIALHRDGTWAAMQAGRVRAETEDDHMEECSGQPSKHFRTDYTGLQENQVDAEMISIDD